MTHAIVASGKSEIHRAGWKAGDPGARVKTMKLSDVCLPFWRPRPDLREASMDGE